MIVDVGDHRDSEGRGRRRGLRRGHRRCRCTQTVCGQLTARLARRAYADFGKGSGHPAGLNFGDCLSYALAIDRREPRLWKGNAFGHTGVQTALDQW